MAEKRPALGRGLSALIPDTPAPPRESTIDVEVDRLLPNRAQPRMQIDEVRLDELARSIKANGIIQPILVRRAPHGYEIVAGERRWRAAQRAGLTRVPVVIRDVPDDKLLQVALIENIQREDLNPIEEASAYRRLMDDLQLRQDDLAIAVGKDRATIANYLRLLKLPDEVRAEVAASTISMGHARALAGLANPADQRRIAREIVARGLSVREVEAIVRKLTAPPTAAPADTPKDVHTRAAEEKLRFVLGTRVRIVRKARGGRIEIDFGSEDELQRVYELIVER